jgi:UDP-N-acetylglucosamine 2-epimerase (non-hydrolysing)
MSTNPPNLVLIPGTPSPPAARRRGDDRPTIVHVVGARPNFVKMAPVIVALERRQIFNQVVVHTGQHYDSRMSDDVLRDLDFPEIDRFLNVGSGTHGVQTARVLSAIEPVLVETEPEVLLVAGDVNSTLACALAASKLGIAIAHLESGLRSLDWSMPEEVNRVLTDRLADTLFTPSSDAVENLEAEGIGAERVYNVGNTMIDSLRRCEPAARALEAWKGAGVGEREYVLVTLHRPSNVDDRERLSAIVSGLVALAGHAPVVFPVHPRTRARLSDDGGLARLESAGVRCIDPVGYLEFLSLQSGAGAIVTDSGGVQEEASALGVSCFTFRPNTERPITLTHGTNVLLADDPAALADVRPSPHPPTPCAIPLWDGHAGDRVADVLVANYALTVGAGVSLAAT